MLVSGESTFLPAVPALMERGAGAGVHWLSFPFKPVRAPRSAQVHLAAPARARAAFSFCNRSMSRVPWHQFEDRQLQAHLVVGVLAQAEGPAGGDELNAVQKLLNRLVRQQKLGGDYASTVVRDTRRPEVYFAFVEEADARKFGDSVQAQTTDTYSGWASHRAFDLPSTKLANLEASLPPPRDNPRQREADAPRLARHVRRGPLGPLRRYDEE